MKSPFRQSPITSWLPGSEVGETRKGVSMEMCISQQNLKSQNECKHLSVEYTCSLFFEIWSGIHQKFPCNLRWDGFLVPKGSLFLSCKGGGESGRQVLGSGREVVETGLGKNVNGLEGYGMGIGDCTK